MKFEVSHKAWWVDSEDGVGVFDEPKMVSDLLAHLFAGVPDSIWGKLPSYSVMECVNYGTSAKITFTIEVADDHDQG